MKKRNHSAIEVLRIILLLFLIASHWFYFDWAQGDYIDTKLIDNFSEISVSSFAIITGMFVFNKRSLVFSNISRLIFIILISILIMFPMLCVNGFNFKEKALSVFVGGRDVWYLYAIIPLYFFGNIFSKKIKAAKSINIFIVGITLFLIGAAGNWISLPGIHTFYLSDIGLFFSIPFLIGLGIFGFLLKRFLSRPEKNSKVLWLIMSLTFLVILEVLSIYGYLSVNQGNPFVILLSIGVVGFCYQINWYSKKVNWIAKRLYFVYEFHWYWQFIWAALFPTFIKEQPHLQLYVNWIAIFLFGSVMSMIITEIQLKVWNKYVSPRMLQTILWAKSKIIRPKVIKEHKL